MSRLRRDLSTRQQGAATLLMVSALALIMAVMLLTTTTVGTMEQRIVGNDLRAREAQEAAQAGLEYGIARAGNSKVPWVSGSNTLSCPGSAPCSGSTPWLTLPTMTGSSTGESYAIRLTFSRSRADSAFIWIRSTSNGATDSSITAVAEAAISPFSVLSARGASAPPLVMGGCMTQTTGTPDIYPRWNDLNGNGVMDPNELGVAIATSQPLQTSDGDICLDYCGPGKNCDPDQATGQPHADLHNGKTRNNLHLPRRPEYPPSIWNYYFNINQIQFRSYASTTLSKTGGAYWISDNGNWPNGTYGSEEDPVIIVFENGCPNPGGNTTVWGILFFLDDSNCNMNGWGNVTVYGSIGITGGVTKMNANLEINHFGRGTKGYPSINWSPIAARQIPGTWRDFNDD